MTGRGRVTGAPLFFDSSCCTCCSDSSCTCCGDAAGTSLSSECLPVVFVVLILFAFVGAIIVVLAGTVFIQKIARTHIHVLQKRGLADDFIVSDLDKEECDRNGIVRSFNQKGNGFYSFNESNNNSYDLVNSNHTNTDIGNLSNDYYMNSHNYNYNSNNGNHGGQHLSNEERNQNRDQIVSPLVSFPTTSDHTFPSSSTPSSNHRTSRMSNIYMDQISESNVRNSFYTSTLHDSEFTDIEEGKVIDADRENTENSLSSAPLLTPHQRRELISLGLL